MDITVEHLDITIGHIRWLSHIVEHSFFMKLVEEIFN